MNNEWERIWKDSAVVQYRNCPGFCWRDWGKARRRLLRSALFWSVTQRIVVYPYRRFWTTYRSYRKGSSSSRKILRGIFNYLRWDRWAVPKRWCESTILRCVKSPKSAYPIYLVYIAAEASYHTRIICRDTHMRGPDSPRASRGEHDHYINVLGMCDVADGDSKTIVVLFLRYACADVGAT